MRLINGPGGVHAGRRVHPRADRGARLLGRGRLLRARARRRRRHGAARRRVDRRGHAVASTSGRWTRAASAPPTASRDVHARAHARGLRDLLRRQVPGPRAPGRAAAAASRRRTPRLAELGAVVRREVRLGAGELVRAERRPRRRVAAPARLGRAALVAGDRRRAPRLPRGGGALRRDVVREDRGLGRRRGRSSSSGCARTASPATSGAITYTQMLNRARRHRVRLHRHAARRGPLPDRHRHGLRAARPRLDPRSTRPTTGRHGRGRHLALRLPRPLGAGGARDPPAADDATAARAFPYMRARELAVGHVPVPRAARHLRRRARLGALLPDRVRPRALGRDLGGRPRARARRGRLQGDRLAAAREGLPRLGRRHHARRHAVRGRPRLRGEARQGRLHRPRGAARGATRAGAAALLPRARRPALGRARLGAGARRRRRSSAA